MKGFTAVHLGSITATLWVLLLNGLVGYQLLDDGTPLSLGLMLLSAIAFFVGTGYIALDTAFSYTNSFVHSLSGPNNRNIALYILYQLFPLICLVGFLLLETILVLRVLGERKPMRLSLLIITSPVPHLRLCSIPICGGTIVRHRPDLSIRDQYPHLSGHQRQDRRCLVRNAFHPSLRRHDMGLLVKHH